MKFYGVKEGRKPGVYNNWSECEEQIKGYSGALFQKSNNEEDAKVYVYGVCDSKPMTQMDFKGYEPGKQYIKPETKEELKNCLVGVLTATTKQDKFEILKNVQDMAMLLGIEIEGVNNVVLFMD